MSMCHFVYQYCTPTGQKIVRPYRTRYINQNESSFRIPDIHHNDRNLAFLEQKYLFRFSNLRPTVYGQMSHQFREPTVRRLTLPLDLATNSKFKVLQLAFVRGVKVVGKEYINGINNFPCDLIQFWRRPFEVAMYIPHRPYCNVP